MCFAGNVCILQVAAGDIKFKAKFQLVFNEAQLFAFQNMHSIVVHFCFVFLAVSLHQIDASNSLLLFGSMAGFSFFI